MIDHIFYCGFSQRHISAYADLEIDLSDHTPITACWGISALANPPKFKKISVEKVLKKSDIFKNSNRFSVLADLSDELGDDTDQLAENFVSNIWSASVDIGAVSDGLKIHKTPLSKSTLKAINRRRKAFLGLKSGDISMDTYRNLKQLASKAVSNDSKQIFINRQNQINDAFLSNDSKTVWKFIKFQSGRGTKPLIDGPIYDKSGNTVTDIEDKLNVWNNHFKSLASDTTGNSRDLSKWEHLVNSDGNYYTECDDVVYWEDIRRALMDTPNGKAPGIDGIPSEILKLAEDEELPDQIWQRYIFNFVNTIWNTEYIPNHLLLVLVVPIPKKGDLKDPNNYRGISLIPTIIKVVAKIITI